MGTMVTLPGRPPQQLRGGQPTAVIAAPWSISAPASASRWGRTSAARILDPAGSGRLQYVRLLGIGRLSDVFLYDQAFPKRRVAVKVLRSRS
ncbi:MAG: hypothetical protein WDM88_01785 [Galbitalea sp.]